MGGQGGAFCYAKTGEEKGSHWCQAPLVQKRGTGQRGTMGRGKVKSKAVVRVKGKGVVRNGVVQGAW
jgi:hypothetical protein